jgi:hypothetical protein
MKFFTEMLYDTGHGVLEFHFTRWSNASAKGYHVAVATGIENSHEFIMQETERTWRIINAAQQPAWIRNIESVLSDSINAHLTKALI